MTDHYISKSFYCIGNTLDKCFNCSYCRVELDKLNVYKLPSQINQHFKKLPVAVNLFYGDPLLQIDNTVDILKRLEKDNHEGPVLIVTKGDLRKFPRTEFNLDLHFSFSTLGLSHEYDKYSHKNMLKNLSIFNKRHYKYKKSLEFRPICYGINDELSIIENVFSIARKHDISIGYSGLQGKPEYVKYWEDNEIALEPFPGFKFGHKKIIPEVLNNALVFLSQQYKVNIFRKTSCLISHTHNLERDYNAHYYRPSEMNCKMCVMKEKCFKYKDNLSTDKSLIKDLIPFDFEIINKEKHECVLKRLKVCEFPTEDCSNIKGNIIKIDEKITTSDVRVIKWLTGYTVDADFYESPYLSDKWVIQNKTK